MGVSSEYLHFYGIVMLDTKSKLLFSDILDAIKLGGVHSLKFTICVLPYLAAALRVMQNSVCSPPRNHNESKWSHIIEPHCLGSTHDPRFGVNGHLHVTLWLMTKPSGTFSALNKAISKHTWSFQSPSSSSILPTASALRLFHSKSAATGRDRLQRLKWCWTDQAYWSGGALAVKQNSNDLFSRPDMHWAWIRNTCLFF